MTRRARLWWLALAASLLLHVGLLSGLNWTLPQWQEAPEPPLIEARLMPPAPVVTPRSAVPPPVPKPRRRPAPPPEPPAEIVESALEREAPADAVPPAAMPNALPVPMPQPVAARPADAEAAGPMLNVLPPRLDLRFEVRYGLASGEQTLVWINGGDAYTVTSVASATGLAGVFYRGRFVQTSRGRITARGLQPEEFWDQRGDKRSSARFDADHGTLTLSAAKGEPRHFSYQGEVQDVLSLFFQLALTAPPEGRVSYQVFNGKKLRHYAYEVRAEEMLETALGVLRTLHLVRLADGDGRFEIWLAADRHYLPVRVLRSDEKGNEVELRVRSIAP